MVNKSDLTDKRDLTGSSLGGQEKSVGKFFPWVEAEKLGAKKPPQVRRPFAF
tara:strand:- start:338 stop:493 length:156 start_codon:yes stop_codon:yes gene_type:complete